MHTYAVTVTWTGNMGTGTARYEGYERRHEITAAGKGKIAGSSDPAFRGEATRWNPEELLVSSLAACHQLWYLHLCADAGIVVTAYVDHASGVIEQGAFRDVTLRPEVTLAAGSDSAQALALHARAHARCFIARSVNFPVRHEPRVKVLE